MPEPKGSELSGPNPLRRISILPRTADGPRPSVFSALRTRKVGSESAGLAVAAAFGVRQLVGAFARGTGESAASWLALAEDSGDKSPHSKRGRDCETAALSRRQVYARR